MRKWLVKLGWWWVLIGFGLVGIIWLGQPKKPVQVLLARSKVMVGNKSELTISGVEYCGVGDLFSCVEVSDGWHRVIIHGDGKPDVVETWIVRDGRIERGGETIVAINSK